MRLLANTAAYAHTVFYKVDRFSCMLWSILCLYSMLDIHGGLFRCLRCLLGWALPTTQCVVQEI